MASNQDDPFYKSELTTILVVSDTKRAKTFYIDKLGADLYREYGGTSVVVQFLGNWLLLVTAGGPTEDKPDIHFTPPENKKAVSHSFTIRVQDCHKSFETLKARGIDFITPPKDWGSEIRCFFYDPDGHLFEISESK
jgi:catechol 2,3-dioxygenase-like lactoylglutathione lyase family enzyme